MITCPRCSGRDPDCDDCKGGGHKPLLRCPQTYYREVSDVMRAFAYMGDGHLPDPGGWLDQSAPLIDAFDVIRAERSAIDEEERRIREVQARVVASKRGR